MRLSGATWWILAVWVLLVGGYTAVVLAVPRGDTLTRFGDVMQCIAPLCANAGLLLNAASPYRRKNAFWMLLALGCTMWMAGQLLWTYFELVLHQPVPNPFVGDVIFFLHTVPMIGALALQPHAQEADHSLRYGYLDFALLLCWWVYLYAFLVIPWQYVVQDVSLYGHNYNQLYTLENLIFLGALGALWLRATSRWRTVYAHLFGAAGLYTLSALTINVAVDQGTYYTGSVYDVPLVASFVWFGTAGIVAYRLNPASEPSAMARKGEGAWPTRLAMAAVLSMPILAVWNMYTSAAPEAVREFRLLVTLAGILLLTFLVFLRQALADEDRLRLLLGSQESLENLKRLQTQFVQSERLASLGQLAAGAAHEINNPLTAILGYSDLLIDDTTLGEKQRGIVERLREQTRRTKTLVTNLLSFARQVPAERSLLDVNTIVSSATQLRMLDLRDKRIRVDLQTESVLPAVRGDANQLLQVFFNVISNAVDAMEDVGGGVLTVRTRRKKGNVLIEFADTGPGIKDPQLVFDPFYTTKAVGKGVGLGLSICYGIIQEHGGHISCYNRAEGGATFEVELPAVFALFPQSTAGAPTNKAS